MGSDSQLVSRGCNFMGANIRDSGGIFRSMSRGMSHYGLFGENFPGGNFSRGESLRVWLVELCWVGVEVTMQNYKSRHAVITIWTKLVNTQTHMHRQLSAQLAEFLKNCKKTDEQNKSNDRYIYITDKWMNEWRCTDFKCVQNPTKRQLSLTQHAHKPSQWAE